MKIFISYNKKEKELAILLAIALADQGFSIWFDEWNIQPGESLIGRIDQGLKSCDVFILFWSENAEKSNWVGTEIKAYIKYPPMDRYVP